MSARLKIIWFLALKDLRIESRNRDVAVAIIMFATLVISIFAIAIESESGANTELGSGVLWASIAFAGVVGLARSMSHEAETDAVWMLMTAPVSRDLIFLGKALGNLIFLLTAIVAIFGVFGVLFNLQVFQPQIIVAGVLGAVGFSGVGTLFSSLTLKARAREILLPMLFLPVVSPLLLTNIQITVETLSGESWHTVSAWIQLAVVYDAVLVSASAFLFGYVLED